VVARSDQAGLPGQALVHEELRRLVESPVLQHAESLCLLLRYLVDHALTKPKEHLKEYQIAVDVFGRPETFDPRIDSTVRVQTSRLRNKLIEYYASLGPQDPVVIEIPRGSYTAVFHWRQPEEVTEPPAAAAPIAAPVGPQPARGPWGWLLATVFALVAGGLIGWLVLPRSIFGAAALPISSHPELRAFWSSVLKSPEPPLVIFSNAEFTGRPETGLRYFDRKAGPADHINDLYTGVGEVLAISELSSLFRALNRQLVVKRSELLSWDETRNRDLIFAGSPNENLSLRDLPLSQEFIFRKALPGEARAGDLAIVNEHPRAGEPARFFASADLPLTEDYSVVMLQPGLHPGQNVLLLAGTTTLGTQAAAEFVSQDDGIASIRKELSIASGREFPPFSAVLHVRITHGVPVETRIAAIHSLVR
jgi:hypothetical protein